MVDEHRVLRLLRALCVGEDEVAVLDGALEDLDPGKPGLLGMDGHERQVWAVRR